MPGSGPVDLNFSTGFSKSTNALDVEKFYRLFIISFFQVFHVSYLVIWLSSCKLVSGFFFHDGEILWQPC